MRWLALLALVVLTGCSSLQRDADAEAARAADHVLPEALIGAISVSDPQSPEERRVAAEKWLSGPYSLVDGLSNVTWAVRGLEGTTLRVDLYLYVESGDLLPPDQGEATWGVACRAYDVAKVVRTITVECPDGTPEEP